MIFSWERILIFLFWVRWEWVAMKETRELVWETTNTEGCKAMSAILWALYT